MSKIRNLELDLKAQRCHANAYARAWGCPDCCESSSLKGRVKLCPVHQAELDDWLSTIYEEEEEE